MGNVTIAFECSKRLYERLLEMQEISGSPSHLDVIRRALAVYEVCIKAKAEGRMVAIQDGNRMLPLEIK